MEPTWIEENITVGTGSTLNVKLSPKSPDTAHPAMLLLHFWGGSNKTWDSFVSCLDQRRIALIAPSMRGWGESSKGHGVDAYHTRDYANDVAGLMEELAQRRPDLMERGIVLTGHSLGGKVAQYAAMNPIIRKHLRGLLLFAPSPAGGFDFDTAMLEKIRHAYDDIETASQTIKTAMLGCVAREDGDLVSLLARDAIHADKDAVTAFSSYGAAEAFESELINALKASEQTSPAAKALVVEGAERQENAEERVAAVLRRAGVVTTYQLVQCGHLLPVEVPEQLASISEDFIRSLV